MATAAPGVKQKDEGPTATAEAAATPVMRQYWAAKREHPEALLLFRLGDFYELFYEDAQTASRVLDLTLTSRNKDKGVPIPMCGVPYHAAEGYIARLIQHGFKVALCDQIKDAPAAPGKDAPAAPRKDAPAAPANVAPAAKAAGEKLVRREVTRVLTPGTAAFALAESENRYLGAVACSPDGAVCGWAVLDVSTGEFRATEFGKQTAAGRIAEEIAQWRPREILYAAPAAPLINVAPSFEAASLAPDPSLARTALDAWWFEPGYAKEVLESHFGVLSLEGFGLAGRPWAQAAAGAIVHYVKETQRSALAHIDRLGYYERQQGLVMDAVTARNLELVEPQYQGEEASTLRAVLDRTQTAMGKRLLRSWILRPAGDLGIIERRQEAVRALLEDWSLRQQVREVLGGIQDLERLLARVALETGMPRDLLGLQASLERVGALKQGIGTEDAVGERLRELTAALDPLPALQGAIRSQIVEAPPATLAEGGYIRGGVNAELDELRTLAHGAKAAIAAIEARERERTGIASLKVRFNNVFGYYLEVSKANLGRVPEDYERKQTLVNAERFTTPELKELERKILSAEERSQALERELFTALRQQVAEQASAIRQNAAAVAEIDLLANFAELAQQRNYCCPQMAATGGMEILDGRHPVIERLALAGGDTGGGEAFVPNSLALDPEGQRLLLLTGPNMGGKSTYLRQAALIVLMAHMGSFVPASKARLPLVDRIFTRIGASDNLARGRSTFMVEMTEAAVILNQATERSLVILDEIGRGTATYDGLALAQAMVEYLHDHTRALTLFATHFHELTALAATLSGLRNAQVAVRETRDGIVFLRKVEAGEASRSYGIEVAKLAGLPRGVIERARAVLAEHEGRGDREQGTGTGNTGGGNSCQLTLFTPEAQRIAVRLQEVDPETMTPIEALNLIVELKRL